MQEIGIEKSREKKGSAIGLWQAEFPTLVSLAKLDINVD
jgi:hypothetical protein